MFEYEVFHLTFITCKLKLMICLKKTGRWTLILTECRIICAFYWHKTPLQATHKEANSTQQNGRLVAYNEKLRNILNAYPFSNSGYQEDKGKAKEFYVQISHIDNTHQTLLPPPWTERLYQWSKCLVHSFVPWVCQFWTSFLPKYRFSNLLEHQSQKVTLLKLPGK